jgi:catechol 2,3-dioxygenase-like lactoylglutathione lyase family enzyme
MAQRIVSISLVVRDYDEALAWYVGVLGFVCLEDAPREGGKRWVRVAPAADSAFSLLLARAANPEQESRIGNQTGGRVFLFVETDDFARDYAALADRGVRFIEEPRHEDYGTVCVFEDLYGNRWDLIERHI